MTLHSIHLSMLDEGTSKFDSSLDGDDMVDKHPINSPKQFIRHKHFLIIAVCKSSHFIWAHESILCRNGIPNANAISNLIVFALL